MGHIRAVIVAILVGSVVCCYGQGEAELHDVSPRTSPVQVSGVVSVVDDSSELVRSYQVEGHFHNVWNKGMVLIVVHFVSDQDNGPSLSLTYQKDYFFSNLLEPEGSDDFRSAIVNLKLVASAPFKMNKWSTAPFLPRLRRRFLSNS